MPGNVRGILFALCALPFVCAFLGKGRPLTARDFVKITENGFEPADSAVDGNHYPWSTTHFEGNRVENDEGGYVHAGTGNIAMLIMGNIDVTLGTPFDNTLVAPLEIWRSRVDEAPPV